MDASDKVRYYAGEDIEIGYDITPASTLLNVYTVCR